MMDFNGGPISPELKSGAITGAVRAELGEDRLVEVTGGKAERLRGFAGAEV